jgi:hypothetical protein
MDTAAWCHLSFLAPVSLLCTGTDQAGHSRADQLDSYQHIIGIGGDLRLASDCVLEGGAYPLTNPVDERSLCHLPSAGHPNPIKLKFVVADRLCPNCRADAVAAARSVISQRRPLCLPKALIAVRL